MSRFQEGSLLRLKRKTGPDAWVFRWYDESNGSRRYRKALVGTVDRYPTRHDAEGAVLALRRNINAEQRPPETVSELIAHYRTEELVPNRKAFATIEATKIYLKRHIEPAWGRKRGRRFVRLRSRRGFTACSTHLEHAAKFETSCPRCSITRCGMNGPTGIPSPK